MIALDGNPDAGRWATGCGARRSTRYCRCSRAASKSSATRTFAPTPRGRRRGWKWSRPSMIRASPTRWSSRTSSPPSSCWRSITTGHGHRDAGVGGQGILQLADQIVVVTAPSLDSAGPLARRLTGSSGTGMAPWWPTAWRSLTRRARSPSSSSTAWKSTSGRAVATWCGSRGMRTWRRGRSRASAATNAKRLPATRRPRSRTASAIPHVGEDAVNLAVVTALAKVNATPDPGGLPGSSVAERLVNGGSSTPCWAAWPAC